MLSKLIVGLWVLCVVHLQRVSAFNLDTQSVMRRRGEADSLFGFSIAMHELKSNERVLLVGAPRAKASPKQNANISGALYRCGFTTQSDDCEQILVDIPGPERDRKEHRENQWLGVRVRSQGPGLKVVTCAHRYQDWSFDNQLVLGRCFVLEQDLKVDADGVDKRSFCLNRPIEKDKFGYCQQGLSVAFSKDNKYLISGAPGAYEWKGTVRMEAVDDFILDPFETGDQNSLRENLIPFSLSSYLGFALDTGMNLLKKGDLTVVAGAPRSNLSGEVVLLRPDQKSEAKTLRIEHILQGPGLASSFGYDLTVLDLNADGWDDLVVGAPQFSKENMDEDVGGAVYVYINQAGGQRWNKIKPVCLTGKSDSMFGLSVANTGDLNQDGFQDFAVGAPYEDKERGRVYVYHGSAEGFRKKPEVLQAEDHNIKLFGYSLAGNMDVDSNGYPDLAVGSLSNSVLVYRSKPVINIEKTLTLTPNSMDLKTRDCKRNQCLIVATSCFTYTAQPATYNPKLRIQYNLSTDLVRKERGLPSRVFLEPEHEQGYQELPGQGKKKCIETNLKLLGEIQDKLSDITIGLSVSLAPGNPKQTIRPFSDLEPVLNVLQKNMSKAQFMFINAGCGSDGICQSNLQLQYSYCTKDQDQDKCYPLTMENGVPVISPGDENVALKVMVTNKGGDDAHQSQLSVTFPEYLPLSSVELDENSETQVQCNRNENKTLVNCQLGNPFKRDSEVAFYLMLNTDNLSLRETGANVTMAPKTISVQKSSPVVAEAKIIFEMQLELLGYAKPSQLFFGGEVKDEKAMKSEEDIGSLVKYEFRISNIGRPLKSFASAVLNIQWPKATKEGKRLLYLVQVTGRKDKIIHCTPSNEISPLRHRKGSSRGRREVGRESKQQALGSESGLFSFLGNERKYKTLKCAEDLKCVEIKCPLEAVDSTAVIVLHARLWNNTFIEEYKSLNYLDIVLDASLSLNGTQENIGIRTSETKVRLTVFPEKKPALLSRVPWWVIFLSLLVALLLLALLFYLLWKLQCFRCGKCADKKSVN